MSDLFLKILNFSINASWLILAVLVLRQLFKKAPKWVSCLLWGLVAVRLICPFSLKSVLSLLPSSEVIPYDIVTVQKPVINTGIAAINSTVNPVISESLAPDIGDSVNPLQVIVIIAAVIWAAGLAAMILYGLISYIRIKIKVRVSVAIDKNIMACDDVETPFILGLFRPVIYVPSYISGKTLEKVIAHEQAHLKRCDHLWKPLGFVLLAVYWFNPLCWIAYIMLCRDIESACDEKVIREKDKEYIAEYSQALLDLSLPGKQVAACPLAFGETGVKGRVKGVLNYKKPAFWIILVALVSCIAAGACFLTDPVTEAADDNNTKENIMQSIERTKIYYYSGNVIEGRNWIEFSITLEPDGTFSYYETPISSFIGMGKYRIKDGILTMVNDKEMTGSNDVFRFRIEGDRLYYIAEGSANFTFVHLEDGEEFVEGVNPVEGWLEQYADQAALAEDFADDPAGEPGEWMTLELPEGYCFSEYTDAAGYTGGFAIISNENYLPDYSPTETEIKAMMEERVLAGTISRISAEDLGVEYNESHIPVAFSLPIQFDPAEYLKTISFGGRSDGWLAVMSLENHAPEDSCNYWCFWFVKEGEDVYYTLTLSETDFSQEEAERIAGTVKIVDSKEK